MKQVGWFLMVAWIVCRVFPAVVLADSGPDHQDREARPIPLGVSGFNATGFPLLTCCSGTLGALVSVGGILHILSNNHVLARTNRGTIGDPVNQPGKAETGCQVAEPDFVADLSDFEPINFSSDNIMDAALARVRSGQVREDGFILDIGVPSSTALTAFIGQEVKKSGRTTGLTTGQVAAINLTVDVGGYCPLCSLCLRSQIARFVGQIAITPGTFSAAGDSGALIVENVTTAPRPVALFFAGSPDVSIGTPIAPVLAAFGATLVGTASGSTADTPAAGGMPVDQRELEAAMAIQERHQDDIMRFPGVAGVGIGRSDRTGGLVLRIFLKDETPEILQNIPEVLEGIGVETVFSGPIKALSCDERLVD